jgi:hypothetical protein
METSCCSTKWTSSVSSSSKALCQPVARSLLLPLSTLAYSLVATATLWLAHRLNLAFFKGVYFNPGHFLLVNMTAPIKFSSDFNISGKGLFQGSRANHKNLPIFLWVSFSLASEFCKLLTQPRKSLKFASASSTVSLDLSLVSGNLPQKVQNPLFLLF